MGPITGLPMPFPFFVAWLVMGAGLFLAFEASLNPSLRKLSVVLLSHILPIGRRQPAAEALATGVLLGMGFLLMATGGVLLRSAIPW
jgi:hypothetical protein